jgi:hypothetical protein
MAQINKKKSNNFLTLDGNTMSCPLCAGRATVTVISTPFALRGILLLAPPATGILIDTDLKKYFKKKNYCT